MSEAMPQQSPEGAPDQDAGSGIDLRWLTPASDSDVRLWRQIRLEMLRGAPEAFGSRYEDHVDSDQEAWRANLQIPGMHTVVAVGGDQPVGAARLMAARGAEDGPELISMYVAPQHRGTGLADRIVQAVAERAAAAGHDALHLHVMVDNPAGRRRYEACGFRVVSEPFRAAPDDPADQRLEVRMDRRLR